MSYTHLQKITSGTAMISGKNVGTTVLLPKRHILKEIPCNFG